MESHQKIVKGVNVGALRSLISYYEERVETSMNAFLNNPPTDLAEIHQTIGKISAYKESLDYFNSIHEEKQGKYEE